MTTAELRALLAKTAPGPWEAVVVEEQTSANGTLYKQWVVRAGTTEICSVFYVTERGANAAKLIAALPELLDRLEAAERDAARYRWLRDEAPQEWIGWADERDAAEATALEVDAAIDRARNVQPGGQERSSVGRTDVVAGSNPAALVPPDQNALDAAIDAAMGEK